MAKQVRPRKEKPGKFQSFEDVSQMRVSSGGFHQGQQAYRPAAKAGYKTATRPPCQTSKSSCTHGGIHIGIWATGGSGQHRGTAASYQPREGTRRCRQCLGSCSQVGVQQWGPGRDRRGTGGRAGGVFWGRGSKRCLLWSSSRCGNPSLRFYGT